MNPDEPVILTEDQAFDLLAFMLATAELNTTEPRGYATRRLIEASEQLAAAMASQSNSQSSKWLIEFRETLASALASRSADPDEFISFVRSITGEIAGELKRRSLASDREVF